MGTDFWVQNFTLIIHYFTKGSLSNEYQNNLVIINGLFLIFIFFPTFLILCWLLYKKRISCLAFFRVIGFLSIALLTPLFYSSYGWGGGLVSVIIIYYYINRMYSLVKKKEEAEMINRGQA